MPAHIHIRDAGGVIGTVRLDEHGRVEGDTAAAKHFIKHYSKGAQSHEDIMKAIVNGLDNSTYMAADLCNNHHEAKVAPIPKEEEDDESSTEPTEVNNPADHWPDYGDVSDSDRHRDPEISNDWS